MPNLHILYYLVPLAILVAIVVVSLRIKLGSQEKLRYTENPELLIAPSYMLIIIVPIMFSYGLMLSFVLPFIPAYVLAGAITLIVLFALYLLCKKFFLWVHLFPNAVVMSYPLKNLRYEIPPSQITGAGYKAEGRGSYYFIQFELNGEQELIKIHDWLMSDWAFRNYFQSKKITYTRIS